jgi:hypothetical protein
MSAIEYEDESPFEIFRMTQTRKQKIHCKQELIVSSLQKFYNELTDKAYMIELLNGESHVSLRLIDWFVTNYSKKHNVAYILNGSEFLVYANYKSQLKAYSKKLFDPFCRRERISFQLPGCDPIITTVGKLNFFRWAYEKEIFKYIEENYEPIEKEMNECMRQQPSRSSTKSSHSTTTSIQSAVSTPSIVSAASTATESGDSGISAISTISAISAISSASKSTRKRRVDSHSIAIKNMQKHTVEIKMTFD